MILFTFKASEADPPPMENDPTSGKWEYPHRWKLAPPMENDPPMEISS